MTHVKRFGIVVVALAWVAALLVSTSGAAPAASSQRFVMDAIGSGPAGGTFRITPAGSVPLKRDTGTYTFRASKKTAVRAGQEVTLYGVTSTWKGKRGTFVLRERVEDVAAARGYRVGTGSWSVLTVRGTGQYAGLKGTGRSAYVLTPTRGPFDRYEGLVTTG